MAWTLKTFKDLRFITKVKLTNPTAELNFGTGYGIRVEVHLAGYDVTILKNGSPTTRTYIPSESLTRLGEDEVTEIMKKVQNFVKFTY